MSTWTRGQLAKAAGIHSETLRYYERTGLLNLPARTSAGYRQYDADALQRVIFIKHTQSLGFMLSEIAELLELQFDAKLSCAQVRQQVHAKVGEIETKIAALATLRETLLALATRCDTECACGANCMVLVAGEKGFTPFQHPSDEQEALARSVCASASALASTMTATAGPSQQSEER